MVLPQAFRIATPLIINQCLNLTKNTSLGVVAAFAETMGVTNTVIGNGQLAIPAILVAMGLYLVLSLAISLVANVANHRLRLVERVAGDRIGTLAEPIVAPEPEPPLRTTLRAAGARQPGLHAAEHPAHCGRGPDRGVGRLPAGPLVPVTGDWAVVRVNLKLFMVGFYPADQLWRLWAAGYVVVAAVAFAGGALSVAAVRRFIDATAGVAARDGGDDDGGAREGRRP